MLVRKMNVGELKAACKGDIPFFDLTYKFDKNGFAKTALKCKFGVIDYNYKVILENKFDDIIILNNGLFVTLLNNELQIYSKSGIPLSNRKFKFLHEALTYARFF